MAGKAVAPSGLTYGQTAQDAALDATGGNPIVTFDPKGYKGPGPGGKGRKYSQCSWQFLDAWADTLDIMAANPKDERAAKYSVRNVNDARLARAWARRIQSGWTDPNASAMPDSLAGSVTGYGSGGSGYGSYGAPRTGGGYTNNAPADPPPAEDADDEWSPR